MQLGRRRLARALFWLFFAILVFAAIAGLANTARVGILDDAGREEIVVARLAAQQIDQTIRAAKILLADTASRWRAAADPVAGAHIAVAEGAESLVFEPQFLALKLLDGDGRLLASSEPDKSGIGETVHPFIEDMLVARTDFELGTTRLSITGNRPSFAVAHRVVGKDGAALGLAVLTIDLVDLRAATEKAFSLRERTLVVVRVNGKTLFRLPDPTMEFAGLDLSDRPFYRAYSAGIVEDQYSALSPFDGTRRVTGFSLSPNRDLLVISTRAQNDILRATLLGHGQMLLIGAFALGVVGLGAAYSTIELRRRTRVIAERELLLHTLSIADSAIAIGSADDGNIVYVNRAFERITRYPQGEVLGRNCRMLQGPGTSPATVAKIREAVAKARPIRVDILNYAKDGTPYWSDLSIAPVRDAEGVLRAFVSAFSDVTPRVEMEDRLRALVQRAEAANSAKDSFLAHMSHELRTPLNAVIGYTDMMLMGINGTLSDRHRGYINDVAASGRHLLAIVEDVLEMARLQQGTRTVAVERFDPAVELREAAALTAAETAKAGSRLEIVAEPGLAATGNALAFRQIAVNLIVNAARHGRPGGRIAARLSAAPNARVQMQIADDGPGFAPNQLAQIGRPFLCKSSFVADKGGAGLGLAIAVELAKRMDGDLLVENAAVGAVATLDLPAAAPEFRAQAV
jgi:PAS domain S-box-containing protein